MAGGSPKTSGARAIHPESLLRIPLVARALSDGKARATARAVDCRWLYHRHINQGVVGFNPFAGRYYYGAVSALGAWLERPREHVKSARPFNERDRLVKEVLFAVHDYLHIWAYSVLAELCPQFRPGEVALDDENLETFAYLHTVTEACATVGLDYWYLSTLDLNGVCDLGTTLNTLTVAYHERYKREYQRFCPTLDVQRPEFLGTVIDFYCCGDFFGFSADDVLLSPLLLGWMRHELVYGELQRKYIRRWLHHLAGKRPPGDDAGRAIRSKARWQRALARELGERLWALAKGNAVDPIRVVAERTWSSPRHAQPDLAFVNLNALDDSEIHRLASKAAPSSFDWLFDQYISRHDFERFDPEKRSRLKSIRDRKDWPALRALCRGEVRLPAVPDEPTEIMLLN